MEQLGYLLAACFAPVNIGYSILLIVVVIYWLLVIIGALGIDLFDFDVDTDADMDMHMDMDADVHADMDMDMDADAHADMDADGGAEAGHGGGFLRGLLLFFNLGEVPVMVFASFLALSLWGIGLTANLFLSTESMLLGLVVFIPNLIASLFVAKICTAPIKKVFRALDKPADIEPDDDVLGRTCVITTSEATSRFGQARITTDGSPLLLNVVTREGKMFKKGQEVAVIEYIKNRDVYVVDKLWESEE